METATLADLRNRNEVSHLITFSTAPPNPPPRASVRMS